MKKLSVAIIGQGRSGRDIHAAHLKSDKRFEIVATVDLLKDRRDRAAQELGCDVYRDYKALLKRDDIDLVVNATPSSLHVPVSLEFLKAKFNVLCEKPLAQRARDVDRLIAASKKSKKILAIFQQSRFAPYFQKACQIMDSGVLGDIVQVSIAFSGFARRYDWQCLTRFMGGSLLNTGPHPLDQALQIFGTDVMPEVHCIMRNATSYGDAEDHVLLTLTGEGRPIINLELSSCRSYPMYTYHVYGTRGGLRGGTSEMKWKYYLPKEAPGKRLRLKPLNGPDGTPAYCTDALKWHKKTWHAPKSRSDLFTYMSKSFYTALHKTLTKGEPLVITPEHVRQQAAVIEECQRQNPHIYGKISRK